MKLIILSATLLTLMSCGRATSQVKFNGDMEQLTTDKSMAAGWRTNSQPGKPIYYPVKVDSLVKQQGKYALSIEKIADGGSFGVINYYIPKTFKGEKIELRGYIKTENVTNGYAGLWLRIDGTQNPLALDNMQNRGIKGTTDWQEYTIELPYDGSKAININAGALLAGGGKIWVDNMKLFIDGQPIEKATVVERKLLGAEADTAFLSGSKIDTVTLNKQQLINLTALGQVWGFVKYYHPNVIKGDFNMDAQLFRVMPAVLKAKNNADLSIALEQWFDKFGTVQRCADCTPYSGNDIKLSPSYGILFTGNVLSKTLTDKLHSILYKKIFTDSYYIAMTPLSNPKFTNELAYGGMKYPDAGYRLLSLYRYWNMIQYFFPYKYLIGEDWNNVLADCIPKFVGAKNATDYTLNNLALIARVHDTHANIWGGYTTLDNYKGKNAVPFKAEFIEDKLVVTGYYNDTLNVKQLVKPGDVIESINGEPVPGLIKKYLPYTPASNYSTQLRDLPSAYLLRGNTHELKLSIQRDGKAQKVTVPALPIAKVNYKEDPAKKGFYLLDNNIGYLYPGNYHNSDLYEIKQLFNSTKGIIIDMRCYPSDFMPYTFGAYIKTNVSAFVMPSGGSIYQPGLFTYRASITIPPANETYKGKVVVIVNEKSQSQAEFTTMAFQSSPNVTVIGSTTAGADGDVSPILLPGGIYTLISGIGIYYPDGTETQRKGIKIDVVAKPTIAGIKAGKDELLDKAKEIVLEKK
ncbi:MAG: S41 family peptidase [Mucilaginibacter sp.]|jgi:C-terminal processing protease CtpA/Prc|uniref:S41 family peptidase n=1 Tax=Mucilaginibacter sp. TaxID=1882438 RepID=UPI0035660CD8